MHGRILKIPVLGRKYSGKGRAAKISESRGLLVQHVIFPNIESPEAWLD